MHIRPGSGTSAITCCNCYAFDYSWRVYGDCQMLYQTPTSQALGPDPTGPMVNPAWLWHFRTAKIALPFCSWMTPTSQALSPGPTGPIRIPDLALALQLLPVAIIMPFIIAGECMETTKCYTSRVKDLHCCIQPYLSITTNNNTNHVEPHFSTYQHHYLIIHFLARLASDKYEKKQKNKKNLKSKESAF